MALCTDEYAADDEEKDAFYDQLQQAVDSIPKHDLKIVMGDYNAQIGTDNIEDGINYVGNQASGDMSDIGLRLLSFNSGTRLLVGCSLFQHKDIRMKTLRSPDAATTNHIDHFCISKRWASSLQDVRAYRCWI